MKHMTHLGLVIVLASTMPVAALAFPIAPPGTEGFKVIVAGTAPIVATYQGNSATYSNDLYLMLDGAGNPGDDGNLANDQLIFNNHASPVGSQVTLGAFPVGTELEFRLYVNNTGNNFYTGPADRNPDSHYHARVQSNWSPNESLVSFEDLFSGPFEYNDLSFSFTNTIGATFVITASAGLGGAIDPSGAVGVDQGASKSFAITPSECYDIADVKVDDVSQGAVASYTFLNVQANHAIAASFEFNGAATITASAGPNGSISPNGDVSVPCGGSQKFTVSTDACFQIADVLVDGVSVGPVSIYMFTNVTANHTLAASFAGSGPFMITASAGPHGSISPSGVVIASACRDTAFTIAPDACYHVADVKVDGVSVGAVTRVVLGSLTANRTIEASFSADGPFTITASAGPHGAINPSGAVAVSCGSNPVFAATPDAGYAIADVLVDGGSVGAVGSYTFTNVTVDHTIDASFVASGGNHSPDCTRARAVPGRIWPPNHNLVPVIVRGVTDPDGDPVAIAVTGVTQDEPLNEKGDGNTCPDAVIADGQAQVRTERSGTGNGRVYAIHFLASDGRGGSCDGSVLVCVPHDQGASDLLAGESGDYRQPPAETGCADDGQTFNSVGPCTSRHPHANGTVAATELTATLRNGNTATLEYSLIGDGDVRIAVYDIAGRRVVTLFTGFQSEGAHALSWSVAGLEQGIYFYRLQAGAATVSKSVLILK